MRLQTWCLVLGGLLLAQAVRAQRVAEIPVNLSVSREPIWHDYGYDVPGPNGKLHHLPMEVPFFRTVSISTTVYVSLDNFATVAEKMQVRRVNGNSDLMVAATAGEIEAVRTLLAKNAMVNTKNMYGSTALMGAAAGGHDEIVKLLLARKAQVNLKNNQGYTALMLAASGGHESTAQLLLDNKAPPDVADAVNRTALMYAIHGGYENVAKLLITHGARTDYTDRAGVSPLSLAASRKDHTNIVVLLTRVPAR